MVDDVSGGDSPDWLTLEDGETVVWRGVPRIQLVGLGVAAGLVFAAPAVVVSAIPLPVALLGILPPLAVWLWVTHTEYLLTSEGAYRRSGIVSRRVVSVGAGTIQNVSYSQGITGTLLDHGTVSIETAGGHGVELAFRYVNDPRAVHRHLEDVLAARRRGRASGEVPGRPEQWAAVLEEVRAIRRLVE